MGDAETRAAERGLAAEVFDYECPKCGWRVSSTRVPRHCKVDMMLAKPGLAEAGDVAQEH